MTGVTQLGYLIFGVSDLAAWRGLAGSVLGMELVPGDTRSTTCVRGSMTCWRLSNRRLAGRQNVSSALC